MGFPSGLRTSFYPSYCFSPQAAGNDTQRDSIQTANNEEALYFIEQHGLMGEGIGYIDVHLLASVILEAGTKLWTLDKRLARLATDLTCAWEEPSRE